MKFGQLTEMKCEKLFTGATQLSTLYYTHLMNPFSIESWFGSDNINKRHNKRVMGKILGGREAHYSRGWGTRRGALLGGDKIGWYRG